ncbi:UDP-N-acetylglucosamine--N-acetylmuramyl- (pentapeptide) pyrophosphoryl-undecaprenol N-acetylglucosamine transferase [Candidatus Hepatincola sp. Pdp]
MVNQKTSNYSKSKNSFHGKAYRKPNYKGDKAKPFKGSSFKATKNLKPKLAKLAIVSGGTGGHIFPAKVLANYLQGNRYQVQLLLDDRARAYQDLESNNNFKVNYIKALGLHKKNIGYIFFMILVLFVGFCQSFALFVRNRPACLISFGGYTSLPPVIAAIILRIPIVMHEQNAYLGKAHRLFVKQAKALAITFADTQNIPKNIKKVEVTGLPIRLPFYLYRNKYYNKNSKFTITIMGGSQGAKIFGTQVVKSFSKFTIEQQKSLIVYHQVRAEDIQEVKQAWQGLPVQVVVQPFFKNMAEIIWQSDLVIARSGASTIKEIELLGKFAIYIPFAKAADNHQLLNAQSAEKMEEAEIILEQEFTSELLFNKILNIFLNQDLYYNKSLEIKKQAITNATERLTNLITTFALSAKQEN